MRVLRRRPERAFRVAFVNPGELSFFSLLSSVCSRLGSPVSPIWRAGEELHINEPVQKSLTRQRVDPPQTASLVARQSKSGHFEELAANPSD
jgi:hypothetical protein